MSDDQDRPAADNGAGNNAPSPSKRAAKRPAWMWWAIGAAAVLGIVALVVLLGTPEVTTPLTVGLTQDEAEAAIRLSGLTVGRVSEVETIDVEPDTVVSQTPIPGAEVAEGSAVNLEVAVTPVVEVPDVIGLTLEEANEAIVVATLRPGAVEYVFDKGVEAGRVVSQSPEPGTEVSVAAAVDVVASKGAEQNQVPNVVGLSQPDAAGALDAAGLIATTVAAESETVKAGNVIAQSPAGGTMVDPGSTVTLTVSTGAPEPEAPAATPPTTPPAGSSDASDTEKPEEPAAEPPSTKTTVPDVVGMKILDAIKAIRDADLKLGFAFGPNDDYILKVAEQDPVADSEVEPGSVVTITIGLPQWLYDLEIQPLPSDEATTSSP